MKLNFQSVGFIFSLLTLGAAIAFWSDLFLFSKTIRLPEWTKILPSPIDAPKYIAFLCLIPVTLSASTLANAAASISKVILLAPLLALYGYALQTGNLSHLPFNLVFHYVWVIGFHCLLPSIILLGLRALWQFGRCRMGGA